MGGRKKKERERFEEGEDTRKCERKEESGREGENVRSKCWTLQC